MSNEIQAQIRGLALVAPYALQASQDIANATTSADSATVSIRAQIAAMVMVAPSATLGDLRAELKKQYPATNTKGAPAVAKGRALKGLAFETTLATVASMASGVDFATVTVADFDALVTKASGLIQTSEAQAGKAQAKSKVVSPFQSARDAAMVAEHEASIIAAAKANEAAAPVTALDLVAIVTNAITELRTMAESGDADAVTGLAMLANDFAPAVTDKARKAA